MLLVIDAISASWRVDFLMLRFAVLAQIVAQVGFVGAERARKLLLAGVSQKMAVQLVLVMKPLLALRALKIPLCMDFSVGSQLRLGCNENFANERSNVGVSRTHRQKPCHRRCTCSA